MSISDAPNIWPHNPTFFCNRFQNDGGLGQPDVRLSKKPDIWPNMQVQIDPGNFFLLENAYVQLLKLFQVVDYEEENMSLWKV